MAIGSFFPVKEETTEQGIKLGDVQVRDLVGGAQIPSSKQCMAVYGIYPF